MALLTISPTITYNSLAGAYIMNRRQVLEYTAWITGIAVSAPLASAILTGCSKHSPEKTTASESSSVSGLPVLHFFTPEQFLLVAQLADIILPRTDSPSGTEANIHTRLDAMLGQVFDAAYKARFKTQWQALQTYLDYKKFDSLDTDAQVDLLQSLETGSNADLAPVKQALIDLKQHFIAYYLTDENVAKQFLNYLPIPVTYQPCISVQDTNNKAWAL